MLPKNEFVASRRNVRRTRSQERHSQRPTQLFQLADSGILVGIASHPIDYVIEKIHPALLFFRVFAGDNEFRKPDYWVQRRDCALLHPTRRLAVTPLDP